MQKSNKIKNNIDKKRLKYIYLIIGSRQILNKIK